MEHAIGVLKRFVHDIVLAWVCKLERHVADMARWSEVWACMKDAAWVWDVCKSDMAVAAAAQIVRDVSEVNDHDGGWAAGAV